MIERFTPRTTIVRIGRTGQPWAFTTAWTVASRCWMSVTARPVMVGDGARVVNVRSAP